MAALAAILLWFYGGSLRVAADAAIAAPDAPQARAVDRWLLTKSLFVLAGVLVAFVLVGNLPLVAMAGGTLLLVLSNRSPAAILARVDWVLLAFFAGLFIVVHALEETGLVNTRPGQGAFDLKDPRILVPGDPGRSLIYYRMSRRGLGQMPHRAQRIVSMMLQAGRREALQVVPRRVFSDQK